MKTKEAKVVDVDNVVTNRKDNIIPRRVKKNGYTNTITSGDTSLDNLTLTKHLELFNR